MTRDANIHYYNTYSALARSTPMITLYFLQASRSIRIAWLLEELGISDWRLEFADRQNQKAPAEFKKQSGSPLGKFPSIRDGDLTLAESGAIVEYLCAKYDKAERIIPPASNAYLRNKVLVWLHAAEGTFMLHALAIVYARWNFPKEVTEAFPDALRQMEKGMAVNVQNDLDWLEREVGASTGNFLVGDRVTAADIMMGFSVEFIFERKLGTEDKTWPRTEAWLKRCQETETYKRAQQKTGYTLHPKTI